MNFRTLAAAVALIAVSAPASAGGCGYHSGCGAYGHGRAVHGHRHVVTTPAVVATRAERVMLSPGKVRHEHVPAQYATSVERVMVAPARVIPAVYKDVTRQVLVRPASTRVVYEAPVYGTVTRQVVVRPATTHVVTYAPVAVGVVKAHRGGYVWPGGSGGHYGRQFHGRHGHGHHGWHR
jgi:hypothetical protein